MNLAASPALSEKNALRRRLLDQRLALSAREVQKRSKRIFENLSKNLEFLLPKEFQSVALYYPIKGEVETRSLFKIFTSMGKT
jgi:5-formyltetrahydrofolate cyclo-ligase